jgi:hypothetical protein
MTYSCAHCPPYKKYGKIYWEPKLKKRLCEVHIVAEYEKDKKKK